MKSSYRKSVLPMAAAVLAISLLAGCAGKNATPSPNASSTPAAAVSPSASPSPTVDPNSVNYSNTQYGFGFALPSSWKGYSIVSDQWEGLSLKSDDGGKVAETGPIISIRDPRWTQQTPRQDIPIMVFTLDQWNSLKKEEYHIGAAPLDPSELGRNNKYVFALPARYNYAFPAGYEEVDTILKGAPLKTFNLN